MQRQRASSSSANSKRSWQIARSRWQRERRRQQLDRCYSCGSRRRRCQATGRRPNAQPTGEWTQSTGRSLTREQHSTRLLSRSSSDRCQAQSRRQPAGAFLHLPQALTLRVYCRASVLSHPMPTWSAGRSRWRRRRPMRLLLSCPLRRNHLASLRLTRWALTNASEFAALTLDSTVTTSSESKTSGLLAPPERAGEADRSLR